MHCIVPKLMNKINKPNWILLHQIPCLGFCKICECSTYWSFVFKTNTFLHEEKKSFYCKHGIRIKWHKINIPVCHNICLTFDCHQ
jgi:hypothetical protein